MPIIPYTQKPEFPSKSTTPDPFTLYPSVFQINDSQPLCLDPFVFSFIRGSILLPSPVVNFVVCQ